MTDHQLEHTLVHHSPQGKLGYWISRLWMRIFGWEVENRLPAGRKFVLIGAPHTSNWDFLFMLAAANIMRVRISWMGKHTLFRWPFGALFRKLGGIPINRAGPHGAVAQMVERFDHSGELLLAVAPSGTRKHVDYWKSGFYRIATEAHVPIACGYLDYAGRRAGIGLVFTPTGEMRADMDRIRAFYADKRGRYAHLESSIQLRDESQE
ncbi:MAG: lysophospholipid acyltransferase family protein [Anaerolineales bacterium]